MNAELMIDELVPVLTSLPPGAPPLATCRISDTIDDAFDGLFAWELSVAGTARRSRRARRRTIRRFVSLYGSWSGRGDVWASAETSVPRL
jgi:hypothetical protein